MQPNHIKEDEGPGGLGSQEEASGGQGDLFRHGQVLILSRTFGGGEGGEGIHLEGMMRWKDMKGTVCVRLLTYLGKSVLYISLYHPSLWYDVEGTYIYIHIGSQP